MNGSQARSSTLKALMLVMLALAAAFVAGTLFVQSAHANEVSKLSVGTQEGSVEKQVGDYIYGFYYNDQGIPESIWIKKYVGSDAEIIIPTSFELGGKTYPLPGRKIHIGEKAFEGNTTLQKVAIPEGCSAILSQAFANCTSLTEAAIHNSVSYIAPDAFEGCPNLKIYRIGGTDLQIDPGLDPGNNPGIGQDANGNVYPGVEVHTVQGSKIDNYVKSVNENSVKTGNKNQIELVYEKDPYAKHTVNPKDNRANQMGKDGTPYGEGASFEALDAAITNYASEADPKGSAFGLLQAKAGKLTKKSVKVTWKKVKGATKYAVYGNACGKKNKMVWLADRTNTNVNFKKVNGKAVKKGTYYKFIVVALDANNNVVSTSKTVHVATPGGKKGNYKKVTTAAKKNKVSIKANKKFKLKGKAVKGSLKVSQHRKVAYESSNPAIATVTSKGVIKGLKKGKCYVYAYAQNGVFAKVKVTVK